MDSFISANIKQRPLRTGISIFGVALGVILVVLTVGLARGMTRDAAERQGNVEAELRMYPSGNISFNSNPLMLRAQYADAILNGVKPTAEDPDIEPRPPVSGVTATTPVGEWMQSSDVGLGFELVDGIDFGSFAKTTEVRIVKGRAIRDGLTPDTEYEAIVDPFYAENAIDKEGRRVDVGSKITLLSHDFTVVGIYEPSQLARVKIPLATMQQLLSGGGDNCTFVMVRVEKPEMVEGVLQTVREFYPGNRFIRTSELPELFSQGMKPVEVFLDVVIGLALVISTLVILLAMYTTIIERTREIGILKSLGASKSFIVILIEKEAAVISAVGVVVGFVLSVMGKYGIEASTRLQIDLLPEWLLISALIGLLGGVAGALYPAVRAANLDPVEALSYE
jgi:putative ABC transport system permease protein